MSWKFSTFVVRNGKTWFFYADTNDDGDACIKVSKVAGIVASTIIIYTSNGEMIKTDGPLAAVTVANGVDGIRPYVVAKRQTKEYGLDTMPGEYDRMITGRTGQWKASPASQSNSTETP